MTKVSTNCVCRVTSSTETETFSALAHLLSVVTQEAAILLPLRIHTGFGFQYLAYAQDVAPSIGGFYLVPKASVPCVIQLLKDMNLWADDHFDLNYLHAHEPAGSKDSCTPFEHKGCQLANFCLPLSYYLAQEAQEQVNAAKIKKKNKNKLPGSVQ